MPDFRESIQLREMFLQTLLEEKNRALALAPEGSLRASVHKKTVQYYQRTGRTGSNGKYLKNGEFDLAKALAQKEYDRRVFLAAKEEKRLLVPLLDFYEFGKDAESQVFSLSGLKKKLIQPIELSDEEYAAWWEAISIPAVKWEEGQKVYLSERKERMRSKSETLIANTLLKHGVPYRYECPLSLNGWTVLPDFTILNKSKRKEIYWEHMGCMDMENYRERNIGKIMEYEKNGYFPGDKLILTFETEKQPLNMELIEELIEKYCV